MKQTLIVDIINTRLQGPRAKQQRPVRTYRMSI